MTITSVIQKRMSPPRFAGPANGAVGATSIDQFQSVNEAPLGLMDPLSVATLAKPTSVGTNGFQLAGKALGLMVALASVTGLAACGEAPPKPKVQSESTVPSQSQTGTVDLSAAKAQEKPAFSEGRTLLVNRAERVTSKQFDPDPSKAAEVRGSRSVYEEAYIKTLVDRQATEIPEGAPKFTAVGVDKNQSSKIYFDSALQPAEFGYETLKSEPFLTRPTRMNGQGSGVSDSISQYQLSCIYNLEQPATLDGVQLEPGLYRLITLAPTSNVATKGMDRGVCPGHRLAPSGSGIAGDYVPLQTNADGQQLRVHPDDIVQIWTLTPAEAAQYQK